MSAVATWPASSSRASRSSWVTGTSVSPNTTSTPSEARGPMPTRAALAKPRSRRVLPSGRGPRQARPSASSARRSAGTSEARSAGERRRGRRRRPPRGSAFPPPAGRRRERPPGSGPRRGRGRRPRGDRAARARRSRRRRGGGPGCGRRRARARCRWSRGCGRRRPPPGAARPRRSSSSGAPQTSMCPSEPSRPWQLGARSPTTRRSRRRPRWRGRRRRPEASWPTRRPPRAPVAASAAASTDGARRSGRRSADIRSMISASRPGLTTLHPFRFRAVTRRPPRQCSSIRIDRATGEVKRAGSPQAAQLLVEATGVLGAELGRLGGVPPGALGPAPGDDRDRRQARAPRRGPARPRRSGRSPTWGAWRGRSCRTRPPARR